MKRGGLKGMGKGTGELVRLAKAKAGRAARVGFSGAGYERSIAVIERAVTLVQDEAPPMYLADLEGALLYANRGYRELVGGLSPHGAVSRLPEKLLGALAAVKCGEGKVVTREVLVVGAESRVFEVRHFPLHEDGRLVAVGGVFLDATERTCAERRAQDMRTRFNDVIRSASDWVWEVDAHHRITFVSERITEILGLPPALLMGRHIFEIGRFSASGEGSASDLPAMRAHAPFREEPFAMRDRDGRLRRLQLSGVPFFDPETGRFSGYRGTGTDVTSRYEAERAAERSRRDLERAFEELRRKNVELDLAVEKARAADEAKSQFLAQMSHELRTPLNAILGFAEVISQGMFGPLSETYREYGRNILKAGRHLFSLINDVLDIARIESKTLSLTPLPTRLDSMVNEAIALVAGSAEEKGIDLGAARVEGGWTLMVDPTRARQILVNLLDNAVKFTPGGGRVGIDVEEVGKGMVGITVWDTGPGIAVDQRGRAFEKFQQIHNGGFSRSREGIGLGLSISRELARLMGGDVRVESEPGRGSRFTVSLPLAGGSSPEEA